MNGRSGIRNDAQVWKVCLGLHGVTQFSTNLPSGKKINITKTKPYYTGDQQDLRFLSKKRGISILPPDIPELLRYMFNPENLPHIAENIMPGDKVIEAWKWTPSDEKVIAKLLEVRGYEVKYIKDQTQDDFYEAKDTEKLIKILEDRGYDISLKVEGKSIAETLEELEAEEEVIEEKPKKISKKKSSKKKVGDNNAV